MKRIGVREQIIETASELFYRNGYNATGINQIISSAEIAKATLYHHFKSKEDICLAYLNHMNQTFLEDITIYCKRRKKGEAQILALFDFLSTFFKDRDFNGCWCIKTVSEIPKENIRVRKEIQKQKQDFLKMIEDLIKENLNITRAKQIQALTRKVYLLYESAVGESHLHGEDWPIIESKNICKTLL